MKKWKKPCSKLLELVTEGLVDHEAVLARKSSAVEKEACGKPIAGTKPLSAVTDVGGDPYAQDEKDCVIESMTANDSKP